MKAMHSKAKIQKTYLLVLSILAVANTVPLVFDFTYPHPGFINPYCAV